MRGMSHDRNAEELDEEETWSDGGTVGRDEEEEEEEEEISALALNPSTASSAAKGREERQQWSQIKGISPPSLTH